MMGVDRVFFMAFSIDDFLKFIMAEAKAFEKAGVKTGKVEFTCPVCDGRAVGIRYEHGGRIHGLGSRCTQCGIEHS